MQITKQTASFVLIAIAVMVTLLPTVALVRSEPTATGNSNSPMLRDLDTHFIDAELALANANLEYVLEQNENRASTYPATFVAELRLRINLYEQWKQQLQSTNPSFTAIDIAVAKGELAIAQMQLKADEKLRAALPSAISASQLKRSRLAVDAAKSWLAKVSHPSYAELTQAERTQWRFVTLGKDLLEMRVTNQR